MKRTLVGYVICAGLLLGGCASSEEDVDPSRIEYQTIHTDGEYGPTRTITDAETNAELDRTTEEVEWEDQPVPIEREPDVKATFVFTPNDAPERSLDFGSFNVVATEVRNLSRLVERAVIEVRANTDGMNKELVSIVDGVSRSSTDIQESVRIMEQTLERFEHIEQSAESLKGTAERFTSAI